MKPSEVMTTPAPLAALGMPILFEDNHLLVVAKPAGLLSQAAARGDDNLVDRAKAYVKAAYDKPGNAFIGLVHRLDRNTSGVVVLAKTSKAAERLAEQFRIRSTAKRYLAVVHGVTAERGRLAHLLVEGAARMTALPQLAEWAQSTAAVRAAPTQDAKEASLAFVRLASTPGGGVPGAAASLVEVALETGRKHQIRVQFATVGHRLVGDVRYRGASRTLEPAGWAPLDARIGRPALHARSIAIEHPVSRDERCFIAEIPEDFRKLVGALGWAEDLG